MTGIPTHLFYFCCSDTTDKQARLPTTPNNKSSQTGYLMHKEARLKATARVSLQESGIKDIQEHLLIVQKKARKAKEEADLSPYYRRKSCS